MARLILPRFFSEAELARLLESRYPPGPRGRRDRAILELMAATGLRASEVLALRWGEVTRETVFVRLGKGGKQRYVPLSKRAWEAVEAVRPAGVRRQEAVFRNAWGQPLSRRGLARIVKGYILAAGLQGSCHTLRHYAELQVMPSRDRRTRPSQLVAVLDSA